MKKLVLVENNPLMRLGLCKLLNGLSNEWEIISLDVKGIQCPMDGDGTIDLVVLGLSFDQHESYGAIVTVEKLLRPRHTLLLLESPTAWNQPASGSIASSIYACIDKNASTDALIAAVQLSMSHKEEQFVHVDVALQEKLSPRTLSDTAHTPERHDPELPCLTPRQHEVLELLACGYPIKTVARMMNIATSTAKAHTASLYRQLKVNSRDEAVYTARRMGALLN